MRVMLTVEYDGTNYAGWQRQKNANTVQEEVERAIEKATGKFCSIAGAGRTDAGVHALGQVCHFDTDTTIPADKLSYALNLVLPEDIRIRESRRVADDFHSIKCAKRKPYRYTIYNAPHNCAVNRHYCTYVRRDLDEKLMQAGAAYLVGTHDYASFMAQGTEVKTTVRTIYSLDVTRIGEYIYIDVIGNGFLYNMVRIIAGTLMDVGKGDKPPAWVKEVVEAKRRDAAGATAAAKGLTMMSVTYNTADMTK